MILSVPFCPLPFCPLPFCPRTIVRCTKYIYVLHVVTINSCFFDIEVTGTVASPQIHTWDASLTQRWLCTQLKLATQSHGRQVQASAYYHLSKIFTYVILLN